MAYVMTVTHIYVPGYDNNTVCVHCYFTYLLMSLIFMVIVFVFNKNYWTVILFVMLLVNSCLKLYRNLSRVEGKHNLWPPAETVYCRPLIGGMARFFCTWYICDNNSWKGEWCRCDRHTLFCTRQKNCDQKTTRV